MTVALALSEVSFTYPEGEAPALADVTLEVPEGIFALATGPTGAGKSTLLRTANGLVPHFTGGTFAGRVRVAGRDTLAHAPRELADTVAFVPQDPAASFVLDRVEDELAYGMENLAVPPERMRRRVEEMLDLLGIEPLRDRSVRSISGGERQRVAIGAALAAGPRVLVLDEPTSQLDPQGAEDVMAALQRLVHDHGMTVLLAEHRLERVAGFVDMAIGVTDGSVEAGEPGEVLARLGGGPPVARLGRLAGWDRMPLTVREARATGIRPMGPPSARSVPALGDPLLIARGLAAGYDDGPEVLRRIDLQIRQGEVLALMGRNGAGKSTLLRCLAGSMQPMQGGVSVPAHAPRPGVDVALCPQEPETILFNDTVEGEIAATLAALPSGRLHPSAGEILDRLRIRALARRHPRDTSAGQRLLVATAAVAATGAPILLLDEPTRGLDPGSKDRLAAFLRDHAAGGGAVVIATHDVELAAAAATRVVMLAGGELIADGTPGQVLGDSHVFAPQMTRAFGPGWLTPEQVAAALS
ncbi:MAG: ATP-binding cassette domain-containing protein [Actinomycetota bacterium]